MRQKLWHSVAGIELERSFISDESMAHSVPTGSAVYAWKRSFRPPSAIAANPLAIAEWIAKTTKTPSAVLPATELSHYLYLHGITIGGAALTEAKVQTLAAWAADPMCRRWLLEVVQSIGTLVPPLYVGETDSLSRRVKEHLGYKTDFSLTLRDKLDLLWRDCELWYCAIPANMLSTDAKQRRTLIELIVARLAVAGCTSRPG